MATWRRDKPPTPSSLVNSFFAAPARVAGSPHSLAARVARALLKVERSLPPREGGGGGEGLKLPKTPLARFSRSQRTRGKPVAPLEFSEPRHWSHGRSARLFHSGALQEHISTAIGNSSLASQSRVDGALQGCKDVWGTLSAAGRELRAPQQYVRTTVAGRRTRITDEVSGRSEDIELVHLRAAHDVPLGADRGGPLVLSAELFSDLRRHHKVAFETRLWGTDGSYVAAFSVCDWAPQAGFGPPTRALAWSQRLNPRTIVFTRGTINKSMKQLTVQPIFKLRKHHELSAVWSGTWQSHMEGGLNYKWLLREGQHGDEEAVQVRALYRRGLSGAHSQCLLRVQAKIGGHVEY